MRSLLFGLTALVLGACKDQQEAITGTTQAAPHVTGIVAQMLQKSATLGVAASLRAGKAEQILIQIPDVNQQVRPGPGADPETPPSWNSDRSGAGLVTADKVLAATP
jgi:subtilisin family serine protease